MAELFYEKIKRRKREKFSPQLDDITYIAGTAPADSTVLNDDVYGDYGICWMHYNWICNTIHADEKRKRALILELTWSTNDMRIVEAKDLTT